MDLKKIKLLANQLSIIINGEDNDAKYIMEKIIENETYVDLAIFPNINIVDIISMINTVPELCDYFYLIPIDTKIGICVKSDIK